MIIKLYWCRTKWTISCWNTSSVVKQSSTKNLSVVVTSRKKIPLALPIKKILPKRNLFLNMSYSSKNSIINILTKKGIFFSILKISVMSISFCALPFAPPNLDFLNFTTMRNVLKNLANLCSMSSWTHLMNSLDAFLVQPTWLDGRKVTVLTWASSYVLC